MEHASRAAQLWCLGRQLALVAGLLMVLAWLDRPDGRLHVVFLAVPGDAVLIQTPRGNFVLVDGGSDPALLALELGERMPFWRRDLSALLLSSGDGQRLPGQLAALARYRTPLVLAPPDLPASENSAAWHALMGQHAARLHAVQRGTQFEIDGLRISVPAASTTALVWQLDYGATSVLLYGAGGPEFDPATLATARPVAALAYPWQRELPGPLLAALQPAAIIFTTAYAAEPAALLTMHERAIGGAAVYHPDLHGSLELISDGRRSWIKHDAR